ADAHCTRGDPGAIEPTVCGPMIVCTRAMGGSPSRRATQWSLDPDGMFETNPTRTPCNAALTQIGALAFHLREAAPPGHAPSDADVRAFGTARDDRAPDGWDAPADPCANVARAA